MVKKDPKECDIFGCRNQKIKNSEVSIMIGEESAKIEVCLEHLEFFRDTDPDLYDIGYTYRRDVEVRLIPAAHFTP